MGELTSIKTGDSDLQDAVPDGRYPFFVRSDKVERSNRYLYDGEAILVPGEGRLGEIFHYINGKFDYHQRVYKISDFNGVAAKFVMYSMMRDFKKHALQNTAKATVDSIRLPTLTEFQFSLPKPEEQKKIGQYFSQIDSLITLHQRKCQYRGLYGYLSWEQRKLGEIFEEYSEKNRADLPPLTIIQGGGTVYRDESNRNLQFDKNSLSNYKAVNPDDFIVHLRSFEGGLEKATYCGLISPAYHTFHGDGIDSDFYYLYFRSKRFIDTDLKPHVYGIRDGRSIDIDGMKTIPIPWTTVNEQRAIGGFYNSLDSFITLHQRQSNGKAHNIIILSRTKNRQLDIAKSAVLGLETRGNSRKLLNEHPIQQRFLDIP